MNKLANWLDTSAASKIADLMVITSNSLADLDARNQIKLIDHILHRVEIAGLTQKIVLQDSKMKWKWISD